MRSTNERTAIVTGGGKRVGRAIVEALLADGWSVVAHVRNSDDDVPEGSVRAAADLAQAGCARTIFAAAATLPPVRLLVNCAARFAPDSLGAFDPAEFEAHMAVNARAPAELIAEFAATDGEGERSVVNILDAKLAAPNPDFLSYTLSKEALAGLTRVAARGLAERGIRVNAIAPALMLISPGQDQANFEKMHRFNPLGRGVEPADVAAAVRYLADARTVTGEVLTLDGGQRFWSLPRDVQFLDPPETL